MTDEQYPPSSWSELKAQFDEIAAMSAGQLEYRTKDLSSDAVESPFFGPSFLRSAEVIVRAELFGAGEYLVGFYDQLAEFGRLIAETRSAALDGVISHNLGAVSIVDVFEAVGRTEGVKTNVDVPLSRLVAIPPEEDEDRRQAAWALLAHGRVDGIEAVLYDDPGVAPPDSTAEFSGAVFAVQRHVARCLHHGSDLETALPAWRSYVELFPLNLLAEQASYPELLWAARSVFVMIGGGDPALLLDWIRDQIT